MSADSTELTFVRCPSCRSLVPALSKSCRMCGAVLDAAGKAEDADAQQRRSGRVRQRTMSQGQDELSAAVNKIREEIGGSDAPAAPKAAVASAAPSFVEPPADDPLSAFVQEVEVPEENPTPSAEPSSKKNGVSEIRNPNPFDDDELDALLAGEKAARTGATTPPEAPPPAEPAPRVIVESGRKQQKGGLSFSKDREEKQEARANDEKPRRDEHGSGHRHDRGRDEGQQRREQRHEQRQEHRHDNRRDQEQRRDHEQRREHDQRRESSDTQRQRHEQSAESPKWSEVPKKNVSGGRLCGWFVSFKESDGRSIELREGKYFVSSRQIRGNDLVIDDRSISSPHAMIALVGDGKMRVQDLMSDKGVFVRRRDENEFVQLMEVATEIHHGDSVRFGDLEFQVCLIAHVGQQ